MTSILFLDCLDNNVPAWVLYGARGMIAAGILLAILFFLYVEWDYRRLIREIRLRQADEMAVDGAE